MTDNKDTRITFRIDDRLNDQLQRRRDDRSKIIRRDLERYYELINTAQLALPKIFTGPESKLLADALRGNDYDAPETIQAIASDVAEAIKYNGLDKKWKVNGPGLIEKLQQLDTLHQYALVDAVGSWWRPEDDSDSIFWPEKSFDMRPYLSPIRFKMVVKGDLKL